MNLVEKFERQVFVSEHADGPTVVQKRVRELCLMLSRMAGVTVYHIDTTIRLQLYTASLFAFSERDCPTISRENLRLRLTIPIA